MCVGEFMGKWANLSPQPNLTSILMLLYVTCYWLGFRIIARDHVNPNPLTLHRPVAPVVYVVLLNKRQIYGGAPKVNCYRCMN